jgi:hypothetical protein
VKFEAVHYRRTAPSPVDLMANQIASWFEPIATALPLVNDGRLKALAVTSLERAFHDSSGLLRDHAHRGRDLDPGIRAANLTLE